MIFDIRRYLFVLLCLFSLAGQAEVLTISVSDEAGAPLADAVVYAVPREPVLITGLPRIEVEQKNREFQPFVSVVPRGTTTFFPNHDGIGHHVYSFSAAKTFELPLSEKEITVPILFDTAGIITVGCNIHDWMVAYINVVDTPYYSKTNIDGEALIESIPFDDYTLHVWHPGMSSVEAFTNEITLGPDSTTEYSFSLGTRPEYFWRPLHPPENEEELY